MPTSVAGGNDGTSNDTTPVEVVPAPASSIQRMVKSLMVENLDTVDATVTVNLINGVATRRISVITLSPGDLMQMNENDLVVLDTTDKSMSIVLSGATTTTQLDWCVAWMDIG